MDDLVCVRTYNSRVEAEIGRGFLESNGIVASVSADDEGGMAPYPFQPAGTGIRLLVRKEDEQRAKEMLDRYTHEIIGSEKIRGGGKD